MSMSLWYIYLRDTSISQPTFEAFACTVYIPSRRMKSPVARRSQLAIAKPDILSFLQVAPKKVYAWKDLVRVLDEQRQAWQLARHTTAADFISFLRKEGGLQERRFRSEPYNRTITRYSYGEPSIYELAQSLNSRGYLSHAGAVALHSLANSEVKALYLNVEQSPKPNVRGLLTQHAIDQAFSRQQRQSNLTYEHGDLKVTIINGKNTDRFEVEAFVGSQSESLQVTSLERTLIDIAVRPSYARGISRVLDAYKSAKDRVSTQRLLPVLQKLDYVYPYHQAIGFLMERTGFSENQLTPLRALGIEFNFYLAHGLKNPAYDPVWRLYYPQSLRDQS